MLGKLPASCLPLITPFEVVLWWVDGVVWCGPLIFIRVHIKDGSLLVVRMASRMGTLSGLVIFLLLLLLILLRQRELRQMMTNIS